MEKVIKCLRKLFEITSNGLTESTKYFNGASTFFLNRLPNMLISTSFSIVPAFYR